MNAEWIANAVAGLAFLTAVTSTVIAVGISRRALRITSYQTATTRVFDIDQMMLQYPTLWSYFHADKPLPGKDDPEYYRVLAAAAMYLDIAEAIWRHHGGYVDSDIVGWREWIHDTFQDSLVMRTKFAEKVYWYPAIVELLKGGGCSRPEHEPMLTLLKVDL